MLYSTYECAYRHCFWALPYITLCSWFKYFWALNYANNCDIHTKPMVAFTQLKQLYWYSVQQFKHSRSFQSQSDSLLPTFSSFKTIFFMGIQQKPVYYQQWTDKDVMLIVDASLVWALWCRLLTRWTDRHKPRFGAHLTTHVSSQLL